MKKRLWQLHSWCGLIAGLGLLLIGVSGSILVFRSEVDRFLDPALRQWKHPPGAARLGFDELFARVRAQLPDYEIAGWETFRDNREPDSAAVERRGDTGDHWTWVRVDPFSGHYFGAVGAAPGRKFTEWLLDLHVSMFLSDWGTVLNGFFAALLCVLGISGVYLYRAFWRHLLRLRWRASARIFCSDLHKAVGISSVAFNLVLGFTGAYWNLPTLASLFHATSEPAAAKPSGNHSLYNTSLSVDAIIAQAQRALPGLKVDTVYLNFPPRYEDISVKGRLPTWNPLRGEYGGEVTFDNQSGEVRKAEDIRAAPLWTQVEDMMTPAHFGSFGGLPVKILWCLGGLAPGTLAISGFTIWAARRRRARLSTNRSESATS